MENFDFESVRDELVELLERKRMKRLRERLEDMNEIDVAAFLMELEDQQMAMVFRMLSKGMAAEVFANLEVENQEHIINTITDTELGSIIEELYVDDAVDMMEELPANVVKRVMRTATSETRDLINQYLKYPENSAGSIMTAEFVDLKKYMNVRESFARIRKIGEDKETIYNCFVTSADRQLEGVVTVKDLLLNSDDDIIEEIMDTNLIYAKTHDDQEEVSELFSRYDLLAVPVVDSEGRLVGIVTVDDVIDVIEQEATEDIEKMAAILPSEKPYLKTGVLSHAKARIPWLLILMFSSVVSSTILDRYEYAYIAVPLLVALMPMLTDTGGNAGAQTSALMIRGMAVGEISPKDILTIWWKELRVSLICGAVLACANFIRLIIQYPGQNAVAFVVCVSLLVTVVLAKSIGTFLPLFAKVCHLDPAIMASPLITTIVDALALLVYFGIATRLLDI